MPAKTMRKAATIMTSTITFGSRGSALARRQTALVAEMLQKTSPQVITRTVILSTQGDRELTKALPQIGGKGLFTAELEAALRRGEIDLAVHSLKDLPVEETPDLIIGAILPREEPGDVLISRAGYTLAALPPRASVGSSSLRRAAQLRIIQPELQILPLRGNIDTRLAKALAEDGAYDAIVLAAAGLNRLGLERHISQYIPYELMLPAPGQGAIAVQCRANDRAILDQLAQIDHFPTRQAVLAERSFLSALGAGCSLPVAALGRVEGDALTLQGLVASLDGRQVVRVNQQGLANQPEPAGRELAQKALAHGAQAILEASRVVSPAR